MSDENRNTFLHLIFFSRAKNIRASAGGGVGANFEQIVIVS
jgi:hypothetical protein